MLENDPKRHMYDISNPNHVLNHANSLGHTPLYVAALNGHLDIIKYLIE
jgi:ankyrin repeat protein